MSKIVNYIENFYSRMEIKSHKHFIIIMIIFAITGSLALFLTIQILLMMNLKELVSPIIFWPLRIIILFIIYLFMYKSNNYNINIHYYEIR